MPGSDACTPANLAYPARYLCWRDLHLSLGPGASFAYAWRLPDLTRGLPPDAQAQARCALGLDLYTLGRFTEAVTALSSLDMPLAVRLCQHIQHLQMGGAISPIPWSPPDTESWPANAPVLQVQAWAADAEARFNHAPRWARPWLDHALDQVDAFSQHHLKVRLLGMKALALDADGQLGEGARFMNVARQLAARQGILPSLERLECPPSTGLC